MEPEITITIVIEAVIAIITAAIVISC